MKAHALKRLVPDESGELVTYLPMTEVARVVGVGNGTLTRWYKAGLIRSVGHIGKSHFVSIVDAAFLRVLTPKQAAELGIIKTSPDQLKIQREYSEKVQRSTQPAPHHFEGWDDFDIDTVITAVEEHRNIKDVALELGRTYYAVCCMIDRLRKTGDLPPAPDGDQSWRWQVKTLLTAGERAKLEEVLA